MHLTSNPIDWYAARAGGIVAYVLLSANVAIGLLMTGKKSMKHWPRFALEDVHRFGGILVGTFLVVHITAVAIDSFIPFSLTSLVVPLIATYRPIWTGARHRRCRTAARARLHEPLPNVEDRLRVLAAGAFRRTSSSGDRRPSTGSGAGPTGAPHGSFRSMRWPSGRSARSPYGACSAAWHPSPEWVLRLAPVTARLIAVVPIGGLSRGPLRFQPKEWNAASFSDTLDGQILVNNGVTRGMVSIAGNGSGRRSVLVRADLLVSPRRLVSTEFQMEYLPERSAL